jgi:phage repressor protein C with HTH and peptisase S24 domain
MGESMLPSFRPGQVVVALPRRPLRVGDVVIVRHENLEKIKRVVHLDGNRLFVVGDNEEASTDSRMFGWLDLEQALVGKVVWPRPSTI